MSKVAVKKNYGYNFHDGLQLASFKKHAKRPQKKDQAKLLPEIVVPDFQLPEGIKFTRTQLPAHEDSQTILQ